MPRLPGALRRAWQTHRAAMDDGRRYSVVQRMAFMDLIDDLRRELLAEMNLSGFDAVDNTLMRRLIRSNARGQPISTVELARQTGVSHTTVWRRVERMIEVGLVRAQAGTRSNQRYLWAEDAIVQRRDDVIDRHLGRFVTALSRVGQEQETDPERRRLKPMQEGLNQLEEGKMT